MSLVDLNIMGNLTYECHEKCENNTCSIYITHECKWCLFAAKTLHIVIAIKETTKTDHYYDNWVYLKIKNVKTHVNKR